MTENACGLPAAAVTSGRLTSCLFKTPDPMVRRAIWGGDANPLRRPDRVLSGEGARAAG